MEESDWSSDVCSSDLGRQVDGEHHVAAERLGVVAVALVPAVEALGAGDDFHKKLRVKTRKALEAGGKSAAYSLQPPALPSAFQ